MTPFVSRADELGDLVEKFRIYHYFYGNPDKYEEDVIHNQNLIYSLLKKQGYFPSITHYSLDSKLAKKFDVPKRTLKNIVIEQKSIKSIKMDIKMGKIYLICDITPIAISTMITLSQRIINTSTLLNWCDITYVFLGPGSLKRKKDFTESSSLKQFLQNASEEIVQFKDSYFIIIDDIEESGCKNLILNSSYKSGVENVLGTYFLHHALKLHFPLENLTLEKKRKKKYRIYNIPEYFKNLNFYNLCVLQSQDTEISSDNDTIDDYDSTSHLTLVELLYNLLLSLDDRIEKKIAMGE